MAAFSEIPLDSLQVGDVFVTGKGAKQIPLTIDGEPVVWQPKEYLSIPWEPSAFNNPEATIVNLVFNATPATTESLRAFDEFSIGILAERSEKLLGQKISLEDMRKRFQPTVKTHEASGMQSWKVKMNTQGKGATRLWDTFRNSLSSSPPDCWTVCTAKCRVKVKGFWIMAREVGVILEAQDVMLDMQAAECPF
jgi:hypothetical protein